MKSTGLEPISPDLSETQLHALAFSSLRAPLSLSRAFSHIKQSFFELCLLWCHLISHFPFTASLPDRISLIYCFILPYLLSSPQTTVVWLMPPLLLQQKPTGDVQIVQFIVALPVLVLSDLYSLFVTHDHPFLPGPFFSYIFHDRLLLPSVSFGVFLLLQIPAPQAPIPSPFFCSTFIAIRLFKPRILMTPKSLTSTLTSLTKLQAGISIGLLDRFTWCPKDT